MLRGEFITPGGVILPNNMTVAGSQALLLAALQGAVLELWAGLVTANPDPELQIEDIEEPTLATNGYARVAIIQDDTGWPGSGLLNNEPYLETDWLIFEAVGGPFDVSVNRVMLCFSDSATTGDVFCLGSAFDPAIIDESTLLADRQFKYRLYNR